MIRDRKLKVYGVQAERKVRSMFATARRYIEIPQIKLQGLWLQETGFKPGDNLNVQCEDGKLIITRVEETA